MEKTKNKKKDVDNYTKKLKAAARNLREDEKVSPENTTAILEYDTYNKIQQVRKPTRIKYIYSLRNFGRMAEKPFKEMNKQDAQETWGRVLDCADWGRASTYNTGKTVKTFWKWMRDDDEFPPEIKWLKPHKPTWKQIDASRCLTMGEVKRMADSALNPRDVAFLKILWESGLRSKEIRNLQIKDIEDLEDSCFLNVDETKTDAPRKVYIFVFYSDLKRWLQKHPRKNPDAYVFPNMLNGHQHQPLTNKAANKLTSVAARRIKLEGKSTNLHWFRHSSISYFVQTKDFTTAELSMKYWGLPNSTQLQRYAHLNAYTTHARIQGNGNAQEYAPRTQVCSVCGAGNDGLSESCRDCQSKLGRAYQAHHDLFVYSIAKKFDKLIREKPGVLKEFGIDLDVRV